MDHTQANRIPGLLRSQKDISVATLKTLGSASVVGDQGVLETSRLENFPLDQLDLQVAVGLTGAFLCSQAFGAAMAEDVKGA